jgi:hypothetical protein
MKKLEKRDPAELLPGKLPDPIKFESQRDFVRQVLETEVDLRASGSRFVPASAEGPKSPSVVYRQQVNSSGSPSETVAEGYVWAPGTELTRRAVVAGIEGRPQ